MIKAGKPCGCRERERERESYNLVAEKSDYSISCARKIVFAFFGLKYLNSEISQFLIG